MTNRVAEIDRLLEWADSRSGDVEHRRFFIDDADMPDFVVYRNVPASHFRCLGIYRGQPPKAAPSPQP